MVGFIFLNLRQNFAMRVNNRCHHQFLLQWRFAVAMLLLVAAAWVWCPCGVARTVVIDPGHGGHDCGARGEHVLEKDVNLGVALRVGRLLKKRLKDVKVVFTRDDDRFITLQGRCDIANRAKGDLFVSIHTNSVAATSPNRKKVCGASVYTLGLNRADTNLDVAMRENSVMKLEDDYTTTYSGFDPNSAESYIVFELNQSVYIDRSLKLARSIQSGLVKDAGRKDLGVRQAPFWVLVRTIMPAVLVELDFVCNPEVEEYLGSDKGRDELALAIFNGISNYLHANPAPIAEKEKKDKGKDKAEAKAPASSDADNAGENSGDDAVIYKVQFLTAPRAVPQGDARLKGLKDVDSYTDGGTVKMTVGRFESIGDAQKMLRDVKKKFPDAFIIKTRGGRRIK